MSSAVRVRFAPSPTGFLHIGGLRTALFNFLFAKANNGTFLLRIEDTDKAREVPGSVNALISALNTCGVVHTEGPLLSDPYKQCIGPYGPYIQSQNLPFYRDYANQLIEDGLAYRCFCTSHDLELMREQQKIQGIRTHYDGRCSRLSPSEAKARAAHGEPYVVRMRPLGSSTVVQDMVMGEVRFDSEAVDAQVLLKSDGFPTYHLASVVDDHRMRISHVIRGQEWLMSTPRHLTLYKYFGWTPPHFAHLPLLLNTDRSKLSKRNGDADVNEFLEDGYLPSALVDFAATLGATSLPGDVHSMDELAETFKIDFDPVTKLPILPTVSRTNCVVDIARLDSINHQHIRYSIIEGLKSALPQVLQKNPEVESSTQMKGKSKLLSSSSQPAAEGMKKSASGVTQTAEVAGSSILHKCDVRSFDSSLTCEGCLTVQTLPFTDLELRDGLMPLDLPSCGRKKTEKEGIVSKFDEDVNSLHSIDMIASIVKSQLPRLQQDILGSGTNIEPISDSRLRSLCVLLHARAWKTSDLTKSVFTYAVRGPQYSSVLSSKLCREALNKVLSTPLSDDVGIVDHFSVRKIMLPEQILFFEKVLHKWSSIPDDSKWGIVAYEAAKVSAAEAAHESTSNGKKMSVGKFLLPLRVLVTGSDVGITLPESLRTIGARESINRLKSLIE